VCQCQFLRTGLGHVYTRRVNKGEKVSRKLELTPRKVPKQSRAKMTVDAILEATRRLLVSDGYQDITTNHVADLAGVSIGTLYQYFPSIDSICTRLYQSHKETLTTALGVALAQLGPASKEEAPAVLVECFVATYSAEPAFTARLCQVAPDIGALRKVKESDAESLELLANYLWSNQIEHPKMKALALFFAVDQVCQEAIARDAHALASEELAATLRAMVLSILEG